MNRPYAKALLVLALLLALPQASRAWGPIAHYLITKEALGTDGAAVAPYSNLPDAWASNDWPLNFRLNVNVSEYFCWSHNVKETGLVAGYFWGAFCNIPKRPLYRDDFGLTEPGAVMKTLVEFKLDFSRPASPGSQEPAWGAKNDLVPAYKGFTAHNQADRAVHWRYFMSPIPTPVSEDDAYLLRDPPQHQIIPQTDKDRREAWTIHHCLKETWAEYVLFAQKVLNKTDLTYEDFDSNGKLEMKRRTANGGSENLPSSEIPMLAIPGLSANGYNNPKINVLARLIRLAQAVYRKNRMARSTGHADWVGVEVQSEAKIKQLLRVQDERLANLFNRDRWTIWEATLTTDNGNEISLQVNFADGEAVIQVGPGQAELISHEYEDPEDQKTEWLMLQYLEQNHYAKTKKDEDGNDVPLQVLPAYQWERNDLTLRFNEARCNVSGGIGGD